MSEDKQLKIGVVGGGMMGHGIAYLFAAAGHQVGVFEPSPDVRASTPRRLQSIVELLDDDPRLVRRIRTHDTLIPAMRGSAFVFEAAPEKLPLKQKIFAELESTVAPPTILASNSSAIPSTEIGRHLVHRERVVGTHFSRRIWCRWSKLSRTKRQAPASYAALWSCCARPAKRRSM